MIVFALSTGHEIGLGLVGLAFIVFALLSSMVIPRYRPGFPGQHLTAFVLVTICFFVAMLLAVFFFGRESKAGGETAAAATTAAATTTAATTTAAAPAGNADPAAGKKVFASAGCSGCHTLKDAGASGTTGPNLDDLKPSAERVAKQVENGGKIMPAFKGSLSAQQIQDVAAYVASAAGKA
ncbi:MAG TPA: c-type cytochrome [Gaiellaceae bacterium]|nr:c-type cytochrome [Gaiellaceae bacterium]